MKQITKTQDVFDAMNRTMEMRKTTSLNMDVVGLTINQRTTIQKAAVRAGYRVDTRKVAPNTIRFILR